MANKEKEIRRAEDFDGIHELDNMLPRWWVQLFNVTIVFSVVYFGYYILGPGPSLVETFEKEQKELALDQAKMPASQGFSESVLLAAYQKQETRDQGKATFLAKCASCHGSLGQGGIGPNLTDSYWIHGGRIVDIAKTVSEGVLDKGMPPWKTMLKPEEIIQVVAYVKSLKGTNPPAPKAPQGNLTND